VEQHFIGQPTAAHPVIKPRATSTECAIQQSIPVTDTAVPNADKSRFALKTA